MTWRHGWREVWRHENDSRGQEYQCVLCGLTEFVDDTGALTFGPCPNAGAYAEVTG